MKAMGLQSELLNLDVLREAVENARNRSLDEHCLLCVHVFNISNEVADRLNASLAQLAQTLGGPVMFAEIYPGDFALFLAGWPPARARQVARLIRAVIQKEEKLLGETISVGFLPVQANGEGLDVLLERARNSCRANAERLNSGQRIGSFNCSRSIHEPAAAREVKHDARK